jgi:hypothetical protein
LIINLREKFDPGLATRFYFLDPAKSGRVKFLLRGNRSVGFMGGA